MAVTRHETTECVTTRGRDGDIKKDREGLINFRRRAVREPLSQHDSLSPTALNAVATEAFVVTVAPASTSTTASAFPAASTSLLLDRLSAKLSLPSQPLSLLSKRSHSIHVLMLPTQIVSFLRTSVGVQHASHLRTPSLRVERAR